MDGQFKWLDLLASPVLLENVYIKISMHINVYIFMIEEGLAYTSFPNNAYLS